jgi:hypothetical protein
VAAHNGTQLAVEDAGKRFLKEEYHSMKKIFTLICTLAVAFALAMPVSAKTKKSKKESTSTTETGKAHKKHGRKWSLHKGKKSGQQGEAPGKSKS